MITDNALRLEGRAYGLVVALLRDGKTVEATADRLFLTRGQAQRALGVAYQAWSVPNRTALVHKACMHDLLPPGLCRLRWPVRSLSALELAVLRRLAEGDTYQQISTRLHRPLDTIKTYVKKLLHAFGTPTSMQLVYLAHQEGVLSRGPGTTTLDSSRRRPQQCVRRVVDVHLPELVGEASGA